MCTVSFTPAKGGYILTANRDEDPARGALPPAWRRSPGGVELMAPLDSLKGGTWIAGDRGGRTACVLNGAFQKHRRQPPYRMSRGQLLWDAFEATDFDAFLNGADPEGVEPFTLLLAEPGRLRRWVWDGKLPHLFSHETQEASLWSSSTLYAPDDHARKEAYYLEGLQTRGRSREALLEIHGAEGGGPFILDRPEVRTVSITQASWDGAAPNWQYLNLNKI